MALGKTPIIKDKTLVIEPSEWLVPIKNNYPALEAKYTGLEPTKMPMNKAKTEAIASVRAQWQGKKESDPHLWFWRPAFYH